MQGAIIAIMSAHLLFAVLRLEHLVASDIWMMMRGAEFRKQLEALMKKKQGRRLLSDPCERWKLYNQFGAGKLPWLFFGIQSGRLMSWIANSRGIRKILLGAVRLVWRFFVYVPLSALLVAVYVWLCPWKTSTASSLLLAATAVIVVSCVVVAAEGFLTMLRMGALSNYHYFRWSITKKKEKARRENVAIHELALVVGSAIIAITATTSLILLVGLVFNGYGSFQRGDSVFHQTWRSVYIALTSFLGGGSAEPNNGYGMLTSVLTIAVNVSYLIILVTASQKTWAK